jgi:hypothetical protein
VSRAWTVEVPIIIQPRNKMIGTSTVRRYEEEEADRCACGSLAATVDTFRT